MNKNTARWLWRIHQVTGLATGIFLIVIMWSGAAAVFLPEMDGLISPAPSRVEPRGEMNLTKGYDAVRNDVFAQYDHAHVNRILVPKAPDEPMVVYADGPLEGYTGLKKAAALWALEYTVDPYSGEILYVRDFYNTFGFWLRNLHVRLFDGLYGREIVGVFGLTLLISSMTGLVIYGRFMANAFLGMVRGRTLRIASGDFHKFMGVAVLGFNVVIAATGFWIGWQHHLAPSMGFERPDQYDREPVVEEAEDEALLPDVDAVLAAGREAMPAMKPNILRFSHHGERLATVTGSLPGRAYYRYSATVVMDKASLEVLHSYNPQEGSPGEKLYYAQEALHFGDFGGWPVKTVYLLAGIASGTLGVTGFLVYFGRAARKGATNATWWSGVRPVAYGGAGATALVLASYVATLTLGGAWSIFYWTVFFYFALVPAAVLACLGLGGRALMSRMKTRSLQPQGNES